MKSKDRNTCAVAVVMGSDSDMPIVSECINVLKELCIQYRVTVASAHRTPKRVQAFVAESEKKGVEVFIAAAGGAAHLPGVIASQTFKPVIGVPIMGSSLAGIDSLLSIAQMPGGIPVATMAVGKAGAKNAGVLAAEIIALHNQTVARALKKYRSNLEKEVILKAQKIEEQ